MTAIAGTAKIGWIRNWPRWTPYVAIVWSLVYASLGLYWAVSGRGFPFTSGPEADPLGPIAGRFGSAPAWIIAILVGIPAMALGAAMLLNVRRFRWLLVIAGGLIAAALLLLMTDISLLITLGYIPYTAFGLITGSGNARLFLSSLAQGKWTLMHQLLCLAGGFIWLAATVSYTRRSGDACLYCGRSKIPHGWNSPDQAKRWGRWAVYLAMVAPLFYAFTRYAWAVGIPLGMTEDYWRQGQEKGLWTSGLFLATFALVGALLTLGLVQRWGEAFPRWIPGLAGRKVPIALAVVPAVIAAVLVMVGGIGIWAGYSQLANAAVATEQNLWIVVGPTLLFPAWGLALAVATLGYYYRRRGPCGICGRGTQS